jgi:integrase
MARQRKIPSGIYQRGNRWKVDTHYKGLAIKDSFAFLDAAVENLNKMKSLVDEGKYLEKKKVCKENLGQVIDKYLKWCESIRQKDIRSKKQRAKVIKEVLGSDTLLSKITRQKVEDFQATRLDSVSQKNKQTKMKPATVNREMALLKHVLTKAEEWGIISHNPAKGIKLSKENNRRLRYLTPEECNSLLESCTTQTMRQVITLALHTGMRRGEILNLTWENVNLRDRYIEITDQKNGERSTIPLTQTAIETLRSIPRRVDSKYVFTGKTPDKPFYDLKRQFEKAVKKAELPGVTFHTMRHTCASTLVMAGVDLVTVKEIMRHKTIDMTLRYSHLAPAHKKAAVDALEKALQPKEQATATEAKTA